VTERRNSCFISIIIVDDVVFVIIIKPQRKGPLESDAFSIKAHLIPFSSVLRHVVASETHVTTWSTLCEGYVYFTFKLGANRGDFERRLTPPQNVTPKNDMMASGALIVHNTMHVRLNS